MFSGYNSFFWTILELEASKQLFMGNTIGILKKAFQTQLQANITKSGFD